MGSGPHLYFLHGFCEDSTIWRHLVAGLSQGCTCVLIDLPGFGSSDRVPFTTIPDMADLLKQVLEEVSSDELDLPILFGHSLGGYIIAEYIQRYPNSIGGIGFLHSSVSADTEAKKQNREKSIDFITKNGTSEFFRVFVPGLISVEHRARLRDELVTMVSQTKKSSIVAGLRAMALRPNHHSALKNFRKPVLFLHGANDSYYTKEDIYHQAAIPSIAQLSILPSVGHLSMLEDTKKCLTEVKHFLKLVDSI